VGDGLVSEEDDMAKLRVGADLALPDDAITQTFVIFGKRGSGKSNTGVVLAEEMHRAGGQIIVLDPVGAWWGLKSSADGTEAGLPIYIFGGSHGDLPLEPTAGQKMAQVAIAHRIPMVLDMSGWTSADRAKFVTAFALWMLGHNDRTPVHLFLEEADAFIPQRPYKGEEHMLGAMDRLIRWGRAEGIGATAITQRAAKINKDVTTQAEVLVAHRTIGPQDVAAIKEWIRYHASGDEQQQILSTLPTLPDGTAWLWSPDWLDILRQVPFRRRETFDSASTPKLGEKRVQPKALAPVDIETLRDQIAATVEQAKANDPAELRKQVAALKRELEKRPTETRTETVTERVEVPVLQGPEIDRLEALVREIENLGGRLHDLAGEVRLDLKRATGAAIDTRTVKRPADLRDIRSGRPDGPVQQSTPRPVRVVVDDDGRPLAKAERSILSVLMQYPSRTKKQVALLTGYAMGGGGFNNALGSLRSRGYIEGRDDLSATDAGRDAIGDAWEPLPMGAALLDHWLGQLSKAERLILQALAAAYPDPMSKEDLGAATGYEPTGGGFNNALGRLRTLELVERGPVPRMSDELGEAVTA
jgi:uncharacterized protein